jgi:hypothetical protein
VASSGVTPHAVARLPLHASVGATDASYDICFKQEVDATAASWVTEMLNLLKANTAPLPSPGISTI